MPNYDFPVRDHDRVILDDIGLTLENDEAAMAEAKSGALDLLDDALIKGEVIEHHVIEVMDANGRLVGAVALRELMDRRYGRPIR